VLPNGDYRPEVTFYVPHQTLVLPSVDLNTQQPGSRSDAGLEG
jgi:hypothetical protein